MENKSYGKKTLLVFFYFFIKKTPNYNKIQLKEIGKKFVSKQIFLKVETQKYTKTLVQFFTSFLFFYQSKNPQLKRKTIYILKISRNLYIFY